MDIFQAVRQGDMARVKFLVEEKGADLQVHDAWDTTPLYHAAFTGNQDMVAYLLSNGAQCAEKTFDGERCLYGALNNAVRDQLRKAGFQRAGAGGHDLYLDYVLKLLNNEDAFPDLHLYIDEFEVQAHLFLLAARLPGLGEDVKAMVLENCSSASSAQHRYRKVLHHLMQWCYTARLELPRSLASSCITYLEGRGHKQMAESIVDILEAPGKKVSTIALDPEIGAAKAEMQRDLNLIADHALSQNIACNQWGFDVLIEVGSRQYFAHKAILATRCEYFHVRFNLTSFTEAKEQVTEPVHGKLVTRLRMDQENALEWPTLIRWLYTDLIYDTDMEELVEVLRLADRLVCEGLKQKCEALLRSHVSKDNVLPLLTEAIAMDLDFLSKTCCRVIAEFLPDLISDPQLAELVRESASTIQVREDVDSVPIIDDIRYYNAQLFPTKRYCEDDPDYDEEGNVICLGPEHFARLSPFGKRLVLLQDLLLKEGLEA